MNTISYYENYWSYRGKVRYRRDNSLERPQHQLRPWPVHLTSIIILLLSPQKMSATVIAHYRQLHAWLSVSKLMSRCSECRRQALLQVYKEFANDYIYIYLYIKSSSMMHHKHGREDVKWGTKYRRFLFRCFFFSRSLTWVTEADPENRRSLVLTTFFL